MSKYICLVEDNIDDWTLIDHALSQLKISVEVREFPNGMELLDAFVLYDIQDIPAGIIPIMPGIMPVQRLSNQLFCFCCRLQIERARAREEE